MTNVAEPQSAPGTQKLPSKLRQLLDLMPDVDKVSLLHIARQYQMDLDDPGFLPLLLTTQGITALDAARKSLSEESEKSANLILNRSIAAINERAEAEKSSLVRLREESESHIQQAAADSEKAFHEALAIWADETLHGSIAAALIENAESATAEAQRVAIGAASGFSQVANAAAKEARNAAQICNDAASAVSDAVGKQEPIFIALVFLIGVLIGASGLYFARPPKASDVILDASIVAKQISAECKRVSK